MATRVACTVVWLSARNSLHTCGAEQCIYNHFVISARKAGEALGVTGKPGTGQEMVSWSPAWPCTSSIAEHKSDPPALTFQVLGSQMKATMTGLCDAEARTQGSMHVRRALYPLRQAPSPRSCLNVTHATSQQCRKVMLVPRYLLHSVLNRTLCEDENVLEPALMCIFTAPLLGLLSSKLQLR